MQVSQMAGYVVEQAAYYRGQKSVQDTIIKMAQDFMGSDNLNLLEPRGQFGTRYQGGLDHGKSHHIYTCLSPVARLLFPEADDILLNYSEDSGSSVEPMWYCSWKISIQRS
jgi:DNA topoisomerase-2